MPKKTPAPVQRSKTHRIVTPLILMIVPSMIIIVTVFTYALLHLLFSESAPYSDDVSIYSGSLMKMANIILFGIGVLSVLACIPCFILGLVLLIQRNSNNA